MPRKGAEVLRRVIEEEGASPSTTWVIRDSIKSDINPALEVGARCVLNFYTHASYRRPQEYGDAPRGPFYIARTLAEIRDIIESPARFTMVATL